MKMVGLKTAEEMVRDSDRAIGKRTANHWLETESWEKHGRTVFNDIGAQNAGKHLVQAQKRKRGYTLLSKQSSIMQRL